jgi:hypothetical protein
MECPQCRTDVPDEEWNCPSCRLNVYWARQHFAELAELRGRGGMAQSPTTPGFLISSSKRAFEERAESIVHADSKVRDIARRAMRGDIK